MYEATRAISAHRQIDNRVGGGGSGGTAPSLALLWPLSRVSFSYPHVRTVQCAFGFASFQGCRIWSLQCGRLFHRMQRKRPTSAFNRALTIYTWGYHAPSDRAVSTALATERTRASSPPIPATVSPTGASPDR